MDSGNKKKTTGLRSKRRPRQYPPLDAVSAPVTVVAVGNAISDYPPTAEYSPLEMEIAETLVMLAHGVVSETDAKPKPKPKPKPKKHECNVCGKNYSSGQALGGHKRSHYEGPIIKKRKRVAVAEVDPVECRAEKKTKPDV